MNYSFNEKEKDSSLEHYNWRKANVSNKKVFSHSQSITLQDFQFQETKTYDPFRTQQNSQIKENHLDYDSRKSLSQTPSTRNAFMQNDLKPPLSQVYSVKRKENERIELSSNKNYGRDIVQLEGSKTNYQKSVGISHNFQLSQEKSQMSSQSSVLRFMSQPGREDEDSWCFTDNEIDSRKSSQTLEKPHISRGITRPGPDLVRSDSDLMCSPRFKTQTYDTALSPRKNPRKGKERNRMPAYDDKNPDYDREEKERRKSLSTLSLSTKKSSADFWRENSTSRKQCKNEVGFNAPIDSQKSNLSEESSNSFVSLNRLQRDFGLSNEEIGSQKFKQEKKAYHLEQTVLEDENLKKFSQAINQDPEKQKYSDLRTKVEESSKLTRKDHVLKMNNFELNSRKEDNNAPNRYPETNKKLNDMEKKLKIIQDENKKNLRDFDAKSCSSKVEKEIPKIENKDKFLKISTPKRKGFQESSLSISNRKKDLPFKFTQEKINKKEDENKENEGLNAKIKPQQVFKRAPLQNILSFNDKEKNVSSQEETKKRKYESLETNKMPFFSDINELKKVKLNNQQTQFYQTKQLSRNQNKNTPKKPSQTKIIQENDIESEQMMRAIEIYLFNNGSNETKKNVTKNSNVLNYL